MHLAAARAAAAALAATASSHAILQLGQALFVLWLHTLQLQRKHGCFMQKTTLLAIGER
jgi:hypothetical protein